MPLRLKSLELHGYKTFAASAHFEFAEGITAIVGPNGSGKSNIADAMRWVLGEQSYSLLRAKKTEDMIFAGSELRPRSGMASATIVFDNTNNWLPVDFAEVAVTRRAYRDGHNEYLLNGQQVRLKDIFELLAQSGLSERTYTILGQGLVDASLALKADERRRLFEEAAGIGLYRTRREEALRRLDATKRNLERALDILAELEPRVKSLERQAKRAQEYSQVQADLRLLLRDWYGFHWHRSQLELSEARELSREFETRVHTARETYQALRTTVSQARDRSQGLRARLNSWHRDSSQAHEQRSVISRELAVRDERLHALMDNRQSILTELSRLSEQDHLDVDLLNETDLELKRLTSEYHDARSRVDTARTDLEIKQRERGDLDARLLIARQKLDQLTSRRAELKAHLSELTSRIGSQEQRLAEALIKAGNTQAETEAMEKEHRRLLEKRRAAEALEQAATRELQAKRRDLAELEETRKKQIARIAAKQTEGAGIKAQLDVLEQAESSLAGYAEGARLLLDASRKEKLHGALGALSAALDVPVEYESAIAAALGEYTDAVLLRSGENTEEAITLLDGDSAGRASLLPLDWLVPVELKNIPEHSDCIGIAAGLVKVPAELRPAVDALLGYVLIVRDRKAARAVLSGMPTYVRAVTLRGEVFHASGQVLAGKPAYTAALSRPRQRRELREALTLNENHRTKLQNESEGSARQLAEMVDQVNHLDLDLREKHESVALIASEEQRASVLLETARKHIELQTSMRTNLEKEIAQAAQLKKDATAAFLAIESDITQAQDSVRVQRIALEALSLEEIQTNLAFWNTRAAVAEQVVEEARKRYTGRVQAQEQTRKQQNTLSNKVNDFDLQQKNLDAEKEDLRRQEGGINIRLDELQTLITPAELELADTEKKEAEQQQLETDNQQALAKVERQFNQIQMDYTRKQEALQILRQKIEDDFGLVNFEYQTDVSGPVPLPFEGMVEQLHVLKELPPYLEENLTRQRALLRRMGPVNPDAQQEYEAVRQRHIFMKEQMEDLNKAGADLHQVIAELDELTKTAFFKTFTAVAEEFHDIFHRLFGGGSARLILTDPENLTETGIDIEARLPGRREQGLALLSGGERSLTAIALVFALLKVSPTPVCVMDEVDAMLDEANVGRFRDLLLDLSRETQFVIVTHNRNTVQAADVIYGVTMGRDSSSQVISLRLDEISEDFLE